MQDIPQTSLKRVPPGRRVSVMRSQRCDSVALRLSHQGEVVGWEDASGFISRNPPSIFGALAWVRLVCAWINNRCAPINPCPCAPRAATPPPAVPFVFYMRLRSPLESHRNGSAGCRGDLLRPPGHNIHSPQSQSRCAWKRSRKIVHLRPPSS